MMVTHLLQAELHKPEALDHAAWAAIADPLTRLKTAVQADDRPLIVGCAKELVEATARVVLSARGHPAGSETAFTQVLNAAHQAIEYQPGAGLAPDAAVRQAATLARKLAGTLRELRNAYGTGHGRASVPIIEDEVLETSVDGALLWIRWALRRLQYHIIGSLQPLLLDLRQGGTFYSGTLRERLLAADLTHLPRDDQRLLGIAVGQRASSNTFNVRIEGVEACATSQDEAAWPPAYREGVVQGLFLNEAGRLHVDDGVRGPRLAAEVLALSPTAGEALQALQERVTAAAWNPQMVGLWRQVVGEMKLSAAHLPAQPAELWFAIADHVKSTGERYEADLC
jgi:hypothetical protein